jgi:hypothetical protein
VDDQERGPLLAVAGLPRGAQQQAHALSGFDHEVFDGKAPAQVAPQAVGRDRLAASAREPRGGPEVLGGDGGRVQLDSSEAREGARRPPL